MLKKIAVLLIVATLLNVLLLVFVWIHRMFATGLNPFVASLGLLLPLLIAIPLAVLAIKRLARYYKGKPRFDPAILFLLGFFIFLTGDFISETFIGQSTLDFQLHDTYIVIAHAHVMIFFALIFLAFYAVYSVFPDITRRAMNAPMSYMHFGITLVGAYMLCWPVEYAGLAGMPRRYLDYSSWVNMAQFEAENIFKMYAMILLICVQLLFIVNLIYSAVRGKKPGSVTAK